MSEAKRTPNPSQPPRAARSNVISLYRVRAIRDLVGGICRRGPTLAELVQLATLSEAEVAQRAGGAL